VNLQAVSLAKAAAPSTDTSTSTPGHSHAARPATHPFNHVLGSLIADRGRPSEPANSKKQLPTQDNSADHSMAKGDPPAQPVILRASLKFHLMLPASSKTALNGSDDPDGSDGEGRGANQAAQTTSYFSQLAVLQVAPQLPTPAAGSDPQPPLLEGQDVPRGVTSSGDLLHGQRPQTFLLEPLAPAASDPDKPSFTVNTESDDGQPLPKAELALSVKITPAVAAVPKNASTPPASAANLESTSAPAMGTSQETDTSADSDSEPASKQILKPLAKAQPQVALPNADPTPIVNNQYSPQVMMPVPMVTPATDVAPTATKHESEQPTQPLDARPTVAALPDAATASKTEPVRDLSIRIGNTAGNQVDVKIQERAGEVHVSVLSSNSALTSDLRQQVGDLVGKLDRAGYHAETFKPNSSTPSPQSPNQSDSGQERESSGGRQQQQQQQETAQQQFMGRQKRSNQAQWLQQMNGSFGLTATEGIERQ
jgi:hypothetical protein